MISEAQKDLPQGYPYVDDTTGEILWEISRGYKAPRILEMGSGYGISAMWFCAGGGDGACITLMDLDMSKLQKAKAKLTPFPAFVHLMPGQIVSNLKTLSGPFDLIFVDMDKKDYALVYQEILRLLVHGGTVLIDNLFFGGRIWEEGPAKSNSVGAIWQLLHSLEQNAQFSLSVLPVGDGLGIAQRLKK